METEQLLLRFKFQIVWSGSWKAMIQEVLVAHGQFLEYQYCSCESRSGAPDFSGLFMLCPNIILNFLTGLNTSLDKSCFRQPPEPPNRATSLLLTDVIVPNHFRKVQFFKVTRMKFMKHTGYHIRWYSRFACRYWVFGGSFGYRPLYLEWNQFMSHLTKYSNIKTAHSHGKMFWTTIFRTASHDKGRDLDPFFCWNSPAYRIGNNNNIY